MIKKIIIGSFAIVLSFPYSPSSNLIMMNLTNLYVSSNKKTTLGNGPFLSLVNGSTISPVEYNGEYLLPNQVKMNSNGNLAFTWNNDANNVGSDNYQFGFNIVSFDQNKEKIYSLVNTLNNPIIADNIYINKDANINTINDINGNVFAIDAQNNIYEINYLNGACSATLIKNENENSIYINNILYVDNQVYFISEPNNFGLSSIYNFNSKTHTYDQLKDSSDNPLSMSTYKIIGNNFYIFNNNSKKTYSLNYRDNNYVTTELKKLDSLNLTNCFVCNDQIYFYNDSILDSNLYLINSKNELVIVKNGGNTPIIISKYLIDINQNLYVYSGINDNLYEVNGGNAVAVKLKNNNNPYDNNIFVTNLFTSASGKLYGENTYYNSDGISAIYEINGTTASIVKYNGKVLNASDIVFYNNEVYAYNDFTTSNLYDITDTQNVKELSTLTSYVEKITLNGHDYIVSLDNYEITNVVTNQTLINDDNMPYHLYCLGNNIINSNNGIYIKNTDDDNWIYQKNIEWKNTAN